MAGYPSVRRDVRYVLTDDGRDALLRAKICHCAQLFVRDGVYTCPMCGTVYGVVFGWTWTARKFRGELDRDV